MKGKTKLTCNSKVCMHLYTKGKTEKGLLLWLHARKEKTGGDKFMFTKIFKTVPKTGVRCYFV